jgi:predicted nuclease of predicted toxin-antitoxin system
MRLLLDENLPKRLKSLLAPHDAWTVRDMGWNGKGNGALLALTKQNGFDAPITFDKNLSYQQNFQRYDLPVLVLDAQDNTYDRLALLMPAVLKAIDNGLRPGPMSIS